MYRCEERQYVEVDEEWKAEHLNNISDEELKIKVCALTTSQMVVHRAYEMMLADVEDEIICEYLRNTSQSLDYDIKTSLLLKSRATIAHLAVMHDRSCLLDWLLTFEPRLFSATDAFHGTVVHCAMYFWKFKCLWQLASHKGGTQAFNHPIVNGKTPLLYWQDFWRPLQTLPMIKGFPYDAYDADEVTEYRRHQNVYFCGTSPNYSVGEASANANGNPKLIEFPGLNKDEYIVKSCITRYHSFFLTSEGNLFTCGSNAFNGFGGDAFALKPKKFSIAGGVETISDVSASENHSLFVLNNKSVFVCGKNTFSALGLRTTRDHVDCPQLIRELCNLKLKGIHAAKYHSLAWECQRMAVWGLNGGQLGLSPMRYIVEKPTWIEFRSKDICDSTNEITHVASSDQAVAVVLNSESVFLLSNYKARIVFQLEKTKVQKIDLIRIYGGALDPVCKEQVKENLRAETFQSNVLKLLVATSFGHVFLYVYKPNEAGFASSSYYCHCNFYLSVAPHVKIFLAQKTPFQMYDLEDIKFHSKGFITCGNSVYKCNFQSITNPSNDESLVTLSGKRPTNEHDGFTKVRLADVSASFKLKSSNMSAVSIEHTKPYYIYPQGVEQYEQSIQNDGSFLIRKPDINFGVHEESLTNLSCQRVPKLHQIVGLATDSSSDNFIAIGEALYVQDFATDIAQMERDVLHPPIPGDFDVEIQGTNGKICAHKSILAEFSEYFNALFSSRWQLSTAQNKNELIVVKLDHSRETLERLFKVLYNDPDCWQLTIVQLLELISVCDKLLMLNVKDILERKLLANQWVQERTLARAWRFSQDKHLDKLAKYCIEYTMYNFPYLLEKQQLLSQCEDDLLSACTNNKQRKLSLSEDDCDILPSYQTFSANATSLIQQHLEELIKQQKGTSKNVTTPTPKTPKSQRTKSQVIDKKSEIKVAPKKSIADTDVARQSQTNVDRQNEFVEVKRKTAQNHPKRSNSAVNKSEQMSLVNKTTNDLTNMPNSPSSITLSDFLTSAKSKPTLKQKNAKKAVDIKEGPSHKFINLNKINVDVDEEHSLKEDNDIVGFIGLTVGSPPAWTNKTNADGIQAHDRSFEEALRDERQSRKEYKRRSRKPVNIVQIEDRAISELRKFYNADNVDDEYIEVMRRDPEISFDEFVWRKHRKPSDSIFV